jgi:hypothetical protein
MLFISLVYHLKRKTGEHANQCINMANYFSKRKDFFRLKVLPTRYDASFLKQDLNHHHRLPLDATLAACYASATGNRFKINLI